MNRIKIAILSLKEVCGVIHDKGDKEGADGLYDTLLMARRKRDKIDKEITTATNVLYPPDVWECPVNYPGCKKNCGSYCCGN